MECLCIHEYFSKNVQKASVALLQSSGASFKHFFIDLELHLQCSGVDSLLCHFERWYHIV